MQGGQHQPVKQNNGFFEEFNPKTVRQIQLVTWKQFNK